MGMQFFLSVLARARGRAGDAAGGLALTERATQVMARSGARHYLPEVLRAKGELTLRLDPAGAGGEGWLRQALEAARAGGARSLELRSALSLARLLRDRGRPGEAREILAPVLAWFTEGFGTADLEEARALLTG
jgi:predicted ATPase